MQVIKGTWKIYLVNMPRLLQGGVNFLKKPAGSDPKTHVVKRLLSLCLIALQPSYLPGQIAENMVLLSQYDNDDLPVRSGISYNDVWGFAGPNGKEIAVFGSLDSIYFFDVTNPFNPKRIQAFQGVGRTIWREFKSYKNYIYAIGDDTPEGLVVFDMQYAPDSVLKVHQDDTTFSTSHMLFVDTATAHLYIAGARNGTTSYNLVMMDLRPDPARPRLIKRLDLPGGYVHDLFVRNDTAYCSHGYNGLYIYAIDSTGHYDYLGSLTIYPQQGYNHSGWLHENGRWFIFSDETHNTGLKIFDVSNPKNLKLQSVFRSALLAPSDTASIAHNPYFKGNLAFVSYYHDGIQVFDITQVQQPVRIAYYDTEPHNTNYTGFAGAWGVYPFLPSGNILASDVQHGLFVLRLQIPLALHDFKLQAVKKRGADILEWQISTFADYTSCTLQASTDGVVFEDILILPTPQGHWNISCPEHSYFRIKAMKNATPYYSKIIYVENKVTCRLHLSQNQIIGQGHCPDPLGNIALIHTDGRCVFRTENGRLPITVGDLPAGPYWLIYEGEGRRVYKIISY